MGGVAFFVTALAHFLTVQIVLRTERGEDPARPLTVLVGASLLVLSGVAIVGYVNRVPQWMGGPDTATCREDDARAAWREDRRRVTTVAITPALLEPPPDAVPLSAPARGFLADGDLDALTRASGGSTVCIRVSRGRHVVTGEPI